MVVAWSASSAYPSRLFSTTVKFPPALLLLLGSGFSSRPRVSSIVQIVEVLIREGAQADSVTFVQGKLSAEMILTAI